MTERDMCFKCRWLTTRELPKGRLDYWCVAHEEDLGGSILWRRACQDFVPYTAGLLSSKA